MQNAESNRINVLKADIKKVNAQILGLERQYGKNGYITKKVYATISSVYGGENRTRFSFPANPSLRDLNKISRAIERVSSSAYINKKSREELDKRIKESFISNPKHEHLSTGEIEDLFEYFKDGIFAKIVEITGMSSESLIDVIHELHDSEQDFDVYEVLYSYLRENNDLTLREYIDEMSEEEVGTITASLTGFEMGGSRKKQKKRRKW